MQTNLFVASLSFRMTDDDLHQAFSEIGEVVSARVVMDRETGRSRGFGFVQYKSEDDARRAIRELDGTEVFGRKIAVREAEDKRNGGSRRN